MPPGALVVLNPAADAGRAARLAGWLRDAVRADPDARLIISAGPGETERVTAEAAAEGLGRVVAVGGDGTIQEVLNGLAAGDGSPILGVVPVGSGNDLARSLGLPSAPGVALAIALGAAARPLDLALATNGAGRRRWFGSAGGIGFDAQVAAAMVGRRGWQRGRAGYLLTTLVELRRFSNRAVSISVDGRRTDERVLLVAIANGEFYGGGMRIAPGASVDDGMLDLCVVGDVSRATALGQLANLYRGTHVGHPRVRMDRGREVVIDGDAGTRIHLDGEPFGTLPVRVELHPGRALVAAPMARPAGRIRRASVAEVETGPGP